jgi:activator of HSP90 ATPase
MEVKEMAAQKTASGKTAKTRAGKQTKASKYASKAPKAGRKVISIKQQQFIPATPGEVYEILTDPKLHTAFTGAKATGAARLGGKFSAWNGFISARYIGLEPGKRIVQEWSTAQWPKGAPPSRLEFTLKNKNRGTELTMVQSEVPAEQAPLYRKGWGTNYWKPMKAYFGRQKSNS